MIEIDVPGWKRLRLEHLVLDFNGTLARDGKLVPGVRERLHALAAHLRVLVTTADTFGGVREEMTGLPCEISIVPLDAQAEAKRDQVSRLGAGGAVCIGNGSNDVLMLESAALGIAVIQEEGAFSKSLLASDVVCRSVLDALDLLLEPLRLIATLRS